MRDLAEVLLGGEAVAEEAVADLAGDLGHQLADSGEEDLRHAEPVEVGAGPARRTASSACACRTRRGTRGGPPLSQVSQIARIARISSRMRAAGWLHSIEKRLVMCGLIWLPSPRMNRPFEKRLQVPRHVGERHRVPGEGDGDRRAELELARCARPRAAAAGTGRGSSPPSTHRRSRPPPARPRWRRPWRGRSEIVPSTFIATSSRRDDGPASSVQLLPWSRRKRSTSAASSSPERISSRRPVGAGVGVGGLLGGVVDPLELAHHRLVLVVAGDELVEPLPLDRRPRGAARRPSIAMPVAVAQTVEQGHRRRRVRHRGDVVRDLRPDARATGCPARAAPARARRPCRPARRPSCGGTGARRARPATATSPRGAAAGCAGRRTDRRRARPSGPRRARPARSPTAAAKRCHAMSGSGPVSSSTSWPCGSRPDLRAAVDGHTSRC